jgi:hypothetical protein
MTRNFVKVDSADPASFAYLPAKKIDAKKVCQSVFSYKNKIGEGKYGKVYSACLEEKDCKYVAKISVEYEAFENELRAYNALRSADVTPILYEAYVCEVDGEALTKTNLPDEMLQYIEYEDEHGDIDQTVLVSVLILEKWDGDFRHYVETFGQDIKIWGKRHKSISLTQTQINDILPRLLQLAKRMDEEGVYTSDNIVYRIEDGILQFGFIDFGRSLISKRSHYDYYKKRLESIVQKVI